MLNCFRCRSAREPQLHAALAALLPLLRGACCSSSPLLGGMGLILHSLYHNNRLLFWCLVGALGAHLLFAGMLYAMGIVFKPAPREMRIAIATVKMPAESRATAETARPAARELEREPACATKCRTGIT